MDKYPIPKIEDLFTSLAGRKSFTTLDMSQAYQQLLLDETSKKLVVINIPKVYFNITDSHLGYPLRRGYSKG